MLLQRYNQPADEGFEEVVVREMINPNHPTKKIIVSLSDLHLDSIWSKNENERIKQFILDLTKVAKVGENFLK